MRAMSEVWTPFLLEDLAPGHGFRYHAQNGVHVAQCECGEVLSTAGWAPTIDPRGHLKDACGAHLRICRALGLGRIR